MAKQRHKCTHNLTIQECEWCKKSHSFSMDILLEREVDAMGFTKMKTQSFDVILTCSNTGKDILASIPVSISPLEKLIEVHIRPRR